MGRSAARAGGRIRRRPRARSASASSVRRTRSSTGTPAFAVVVFAKSPIPGGVKTRLAPALGRRGAAALYRRFVRDVLRRFEREAPGVPGVLCVAPPLDRRFFRHVLPGGWALETQRGRDLFDRMAAALGRELDRGRSAAILVGSDAPLLPIRAAVAAASNLAKGRADAAIGLDAGGGYWAIGVSRRARGVLRLALRRGGGRGAATRLALRHKGCRVASLPSTLDVDVPRDLGRLDRALSRRRSAATIPATSDYLAKLRARGRWPRIRDGWGFEPGS